jgi:hypothetical protein
VIFICYRRSDSGVLVTNLRRRLAERFGEDAVFVDYGTPVGTTWPTEIQEKLLKSTILLAVVGRQWGEARFTEGENEGRLRLDNEDDWVRQEICTALHLGPDRIKVIVLLVDDVELPKRTLHGELEKLRRLQHARIRNEDEFESSFAELCRSLERHVAPKAHSPGITPQDALARYLDYGRRVNAMIRLPIVAPDDRLTTAPIDQLRIDLPLMVNHQRDAASASRGPERDALALHDELRGAHTSALWVDRASRVDTVQRDCVIGDKLVAGSRIVVLGDPGCGKSTLLQWIAEHYASRFDDGSPPRDDDPLPVGGWLPILIRCKELAGQAVPSHIDELLRTHLDRQQFSQDEITPLIPRLASLLDEGRALLMIDGLDEVVNSGQRLELARLLIAVGDRFAKAPLIITSRVVGFTLINDELKSSFDYLLVAPLDRAAKRAFIEGWARFVDLGPRRTSALIQVVCNSRVHAKLTENIFLLAMLTQMQAFGYGLPERRVDLYRRAVQLMIDRRGRFPAPVLSVNELVPHLEFLAYRMRQQGKQRLIDRDVLEIFGEMRHAESDESVLRVRSPEELLRATIDSAGLLSIAGTEVDRHGFDRQVIQFFHQSFQEYFAAQAINHGRDGRGEENPVARLRALIETIAVESRNVEIWGKRIAIEPVITEAWQEAVRMAIAGMEPDQADDAVLMLLPMPGTAKHEARPRAIFALQCLVEEPRVRVETAQAVFDVAMDCLIDEDGVNTQHNTWMDEALTAVARSSFGKRMKQQLVEAFIESRGETRRRIGSCTVACWSSEEFIVKPENADATVAFAVRGLSSTDPHRRVSTALELTERFYRTDSKLSFLDERQRATLVNALMAALDEDEASASATMWALSWFTGPPAQIRGFNPTQFVQLDVAAIGKIEEFLQRSDLDSPTLGWGCRILSRRHGADWQDQDFDWIYELA